MYGNIKPTARHLRHITSFGLLPVYRSDSDNVPHDGHTNNIQATRPGTLSLQMKLQRFVVLYVLISLIQLVDIDDNFLSLMNDSGETKDDIKLPDNDVGKEIKTKFDNGESILVTVLVSDTNGWMSGWVDGWMDEWMDG